MKKVKIPTKLRYTVLQRDGLKCLWCGRSVVDGIILHVDHVVPESFGGTTSYDNLGTLCNQCNIGKSNEYCGNYLLSTLLKIKDFESKIEHIDTGSSYDSKGVLYDAMFYEYRISFFKEIDGRYEKEVIEHQYPIPKMLKLYGEEGAIKSDKRKEEALLKFKDKIRDYLFENKGYLNELKGRLIFTKTK